MGAIGGGGIRWNPAHPWPIIVPTMLPLFRAVHQQADRLNFHRMSAALALYVLMSFAPLLVLAIGIAGLVMGPTAAQDGVLAEIGLLLGQGRADAVAAAVTAAAQPSASARATAIGILVLMWSGSRIFFEVERDLSEIWDQDLAPAPSPIWRRWLPMARSRLVSMAFTLLMGLLLLAGLLTGTVLSGFGRFLERYLPGFVDVSALTHAAWLLGLLTTTLGLIYRSLPDRSPRWGSVLVGALAAGGVLCAGMLLVSFGLRLAADNAILTVAISPLISLGGLYLAALVFFYGAALTHALDEGWGGRIRDDAP